MNFNPSDAAIDRRASLSSLGRVQARNQLIAEWLISRVGAVPRIPDVVPLTKDPLSRLGWRQV